MILSNIRLSENLNLLNKKVWLNVLVATFDFIFCNIAYNLARPTTGVMITCSKIIKFGRVTGNW